MIDKPDPSAEPANWAPTKLQSGRGSGPSPTLKTLRAMEIGETLRLIHTDMTCGGNGANCSLNQLLTREQRSHGTKYQSYHEGRYIAVVRRIK